MFSLKTTLASLIFYFISSTAGQAQILMCIDAVDLTKPKKNVEQGAYMINYKWTPGAVLNVSFIDGTAWQQQEVKKYAPIWSNYANVKFNFLSMYSPGADIRISFKPDLGSCSQIGSMAKSIRPGEWTMNYGWINTTTPEEDIKGVVLHEFGHALGLLHEHMNPLGNIQWNKDKVYAYYMSMGWSREKIDMNIFDRYSVSQTNHKYDPKSIMHYPIPKELTLDGYSVGINDELSADDIALIRELYPQNKTFPVSNLTDVWAKLQDASIDYDVTENGKLGMRIRQNFLIYNAQNGKCVMGVYFYNTDTDKPLKDKNGLYKSSTGDVAGYNYFTPTYQNSQFTDLGVFVPYDEFELDNGEYRLKCFVALFDQNLKQISTSGYQYFTYRKGISIKEITIDKVFDDVNQQILIYPVFTIDNGKDILCNAVVYFYTDAGEKLKDLNGKFTSPDGNVADYSTFKPGYPSAVYNSGQKDFWFAIPYSELHLPKGFHKLEFWVWLYDNNWKPIKNSEMVHFTFQQD